MKLKQRSKGGVWYAHFTGGNGERLRLSTGTADESMAQLKALELMREHLVDKLSEEDRQKHGDLETLSSMLRTAWHKRWQHQKSAAHKRKQVTKIAREIGYWSRSMVTYDRVEEYLEHLCYGTKDPQPLSNATKNRYAATIHTAFIVANAKDTSVVVPKLPHWPENNVTERYLSATEEGRILDWFEQNVPAADLERTYLRNLFVVLLDTGMRCGEALEQMKGSSLLPSPEAPEKVHLKHGQTKSGNGRVVPLTERARASVLAMLASPLHGTWTSSNAGNYWRTITAKLNLSDVNLHVLRHTTASRLVQAGVDLYQVSVWLGHSSMEVTRRYAHFAPDSLSGALKALEGRPEAVPTLPPQPVALSPVDAADFAAFLEWRRQSGGDVPSNPPLYPIAEAHPPHSGTQKRANLRVIK